MARKIILSTHLTFIQVRRKSTGRVEMEMKMRFVQVLDRNNWYFNQTAQVLREEDGILWVRVLGTIPAEFALRIEQSAVAKSSTLMQDAESAQR